MVSPLMSLGARALTASYAVLQTAGHNIANANTAGYSRQEVGLQTAQSQATGSGYFGRGVDVKSLGIPTESEYIRSYCERTGLTTPEALAPDWNFYQAYNMFRIAAILQGIAKRVEAGTASSEQAVASGRGARPMAEMAWKFAQQA